MRKRKLDPKIIRVNDNVKIVTPESFVRCGYPLCKADLKQGIYEAYGKVIQDLIYSAGQGNKFIKQNENGGYPGTKRLFGEDFPHPLDINNEFIDLLASIQLKAKGFGGNTRGIFTKSYPTIKDKIFRVSHIRFVTTGERIPGSRYRGYWDDECEPPMLINTKTHKILELDLCKKDIDDDFKTKHLKTNTAPWIEYMSVEIEAKNVEKQPDERETIQDEEGNWVKNPMYNFYED